MGKNILLPLLLNSEWDKAVKCVRADNDRARKWIVTQSFTGNISKTEILPIHQACSTADVQLNIIEVLALVHPDSLLLPESVTLRTPLHIAMRARVSDEIIAFLMKKCPKAISVMDAWGRIPLHYACSNAVPTVTINRLIWSCPESVGASDNSGWTPLHVASSLYETPDGVEAMLDACPEAVLLITSTGCSSYTIAKINTSSAKERVCEILTKVELEFLKMPVFLNIRAAEMRMQISEEKGGNEIFPTHDLRASKTSGVRKRVRSNSIRIVV